MTTRARGAHAREIAIAEVRARHDRPLQRRRAGVVTWWACFAALWLQAPPAAAYLTRASFAQSTEQGGGGGRYFTGSPLDQQGCDVCHRGGSVVPDMFFALPIPEFYEPGQTYNLAVQWAQGQGAASMEVVNSLGRGIGTVALVDEQASLCTNGTPSASIQTDEANNRTLAGNNACGAYLLHIAWTAPVDPAGNAYVFATTVLAGTEEGQGQPSGDRAEALRAVIPPKGEGASVANVRSSCQAGSTGTTPSAALWALLVGLALAARARFSLRPYR